MTTPTAITTIEEEAFTIDGDQRSHPIYSFNTEGQRVQVGRVATRSFRGEGVQRLLYRPTGSEETYSLGAVSESFQIIDHAQVLQPWMDAGYRIIKSHYTRGGSQLWAQLLPAQPLTFEDMITWDQGLWGVKGSGLRESIVITTSIRPKRSIAMRRGWFRLVCTNGMVAEVLGLGALKMSHLSFSVDKVERFIEESSPYVKRIGEQGPARLMGPWVGTTKGAARLAEVISRHLLSNLLGASEGSAGDDGEEIEEESPVTASQWEDTVPLFVRGSVATLARQPNWYLRSLAQQLTLMDEGGSERLYALDILNGITNPISLAEEGQSVSRPLNNTNALTTSVINLIGGLSL